MNMRARTTGDAAGEKIDARRTSWLSQGFEELLDRDRQRRPAGKNEVHFDVVIVGSGYGGAMAAVELAGCTLKDRPISVCVLERGSEYLPGMFPAGLAELPTHVRFSTPSSSQAGGRRTGLFDVRAGGDVNALVANGLGGGSLINAGVMAIPAPEVFTERWPEDFRSEAGRSVWYDRATRLLGGVQTTDGVAKYGVLERLAKNGNKGVRVEPAPLSTRVARDATGAKPKFGACIHCGDCATGCNHGAKNSLDASLLARAKARGAHIFTGATVLRVLRGSRGRPWSLEVVHTDAKLRARQDAPLRLHAHRIILAAGTFGSTEILLRSSSRVLALSPRLGRGFSANGDSLAALYGHDEPAANAVVDESVAPAQREVGPTITGMLRVPGKNGPPIVIEELAIPGALGRLFEEVVSTANVLHSLDRRDMKPHSPKDADPCAVDRDLIRRSSLFALMGDDGAEGAIELVGGDDETDGDGAVRVRWAEISNHPVFDEQLELLGDLAKSSGVGGTVLPNPLWRFVPTGIEELFENRRGPAFTVHPLGGCTIGTSWRDGVVDEFGRVFRGPTSRTDKDCWDGLVVLDGSIVPTALATNPALTIAALALRAVSQLRKDWKLELPTKAFKPLESPLRFRKPRPPRRVDNRFELVERLQGSATLTLDGGATERCAVEITLRFRPFSLDRIIGPHKEHLEVDENASSLRIYRDQEWRDGKRAGRTREELTALAAITVPLRGCLTALRREVSDERTRRCRALRAWICNRGVRDSWQWALERLSRRPQRAGPDSPIEPSPDDGRLARVLCRVLGRSALGRAIWRKAVNARALASHAGEARVLEYDLQVAGDVVGNALKISGLARDARITGRKRFTYDRRSNPWRQLQELTVDRFPGLGGSDKLDLALDLRHFGEQSVPLMRIVEQQNQPAALADVVSLFAYVLRLMIVVHVWSFRRPEEARPAEPQRLPGVLRPGLFNRHKPTITELVVDERPDGTPVHVRLTHYHPRRSEGRPVVMIHGYSASGTTFAHDAVRPNLATYFLARHRDVWVLDLRTSSGMPTARLDWTFEDAALVDIPAAIDHVVRESKQEKVDIIAHCMGSAMLSMAVLARPQAGEKFAREREALPRRIGRAVLSQVAPLVEFSPANVLRGYVLGYVRLFLPLQRYEFRTGPDPSLTDQLIDRLLATLPYPEEEFDIENPPWWLFWRTTPWVGTRHRMDALYAQDFSLKNIPRRVLKHIDDLFGPLNIETVSQGIHFARNNVITNRAGRNVYVSRRQLKERWTFPTLCVHGEDNGLADVATLAHMRRGFDDAHIGHLLAPPLAFKGFGHQDSLIGRGARAVFDEMARFFELKDEPVPAKGANPKIRATVPWLGPHVGPLMRENRITSLPVRAATHPGRERAEFAVFLPVREHDGRFALRRKDGVYAPEEPNNATDWGTVQLPSRPQDADGWLRLNLTNPASWAEGAEGILMLLLDDDPEGLELELPKYRELRAAVGRRGVPFTLGITTARDLFEDSDPILKDFTTQDEKDFERYLGRIRDALRRELKRPSTELRRALIEIPRSENLCFAFGSCQYPAGFLDAAVADRSMKMLEARLEEPQSESRPNFLLLLGDQVYVDATAGLFDPTSADDRYVAPYERLYERSAVQSVLRRLPSYMMLDDHEIEDNWEPRRQDGAANIQLIQARRSYWRYQRFDKFEEPGREFEPGLSLEFKQAEIPFYLADTRTRRTGRTTENHQRARIMNDAEFQALIAWLIKCHQEKPHAPKFIACPAMPLPRSLRMLGASSDAAALHSDGWEGYPQSLRQLLGYIAVHGIHNVVFLSGDAHLSCVATVTLKADARDPVTAYSIHSSALYAPFPFANSDRADFPHKDAFEFKVDPVSPSADDIENAFVHRNCRCEVSTKFAPRHDGFAILRIESRDPQILVCEFVRHDSTGHNQCGKVWTRELPLV